MNKIRSCAFRRSSRRAFAFIAFFALTGLLSACASPNAQIPATNTPTVAPTSFPATTSVTSTPAPTPVTIPTLPSVSPLTFVYKITGDTVDPLASSNAFAFDKQGNIYVADASNRRIVKLDTNGKTLAKWGSSGSDEGQFNQMEGIFADRDGFIYVADRTNSSIQKFRQSDFRR